jgi:hypothetical protein
MDKFNVELKGMGMFKLDNLQRADRRIRDFIRQDSRVRPGSAVLSYEEKNRITAELNDDACQIAAREGLSGLARPFVQLQYLGRELSVELLWGAGAGFDAAANQLDEYRRAMKIAYGILWHSNLMPESQRKGYSAAEGCRKARGFLVAVLTANELRDGINEIGVSLGKEGLAPSDGADPMSIKREDVRVSVAGTLSDEYIAGIESESMDSVDLVRVLGGAGDAAKEAATMLRDMADKFEELAKSEDPTKVDEQDRVNGIG